MQLGWVLVELAKPVVDSGSCIKHYILSFLPTIRRTSMACTQDIAPMMYLVAFGTSRICTFNQVEFLHSLDLSSWGYFPRFHGDY
jgi:hypothetical protein